MTKFTFTFQGGRLVQEVTSVTLVNNTAKTIDTTVPAGKRWILLSMIIINPDDVQRNLNVRKFKEPAKTNMIKHMVSLALAATTRHQFPSVLPTATLMTQSPRPAEFAKAGNTYEIVWAAGGASAGGTDADGLVIEWLEIDV